jgi:fucose 4-O-acetylase-like acetyltransferase
MIKWINFAKFIAIVAVVIDHNFHILYENYFYAKSTYFSVTVFIFLSGYTTYLSLNKHKDFSYYNYLKKKLVTILIPYALSVLFYSLISHEYITIQNYIDRLIRFN